jgi:hypothetical protein
MLSSYFISVVNGVLDWDWHCWDNYVRPGGVILPGDWFHLCSEHVTISVVYDHGGRWFVRDEKLVCGGTAAWNHGSYPFDVGDHDSVVRAFRGALSYYVSSLS